MKDAVKGWTCGEGIQKLITGFDKYLSDGGDYLE
jgi:hypothetical protein